MTDLLEEVLQDETYEKKLQQFKRVLPYVISLSIIIALSLFIYNNYQLKQLQLIQDKGDILIMADQAAELQVLSAEKGNLSELSRLKQVSLYLQGDNTLSAREELNRLINDQNISQETLAFARISIMSLILAQTISLQDNILFDDLRKHFSSENDLYFGYANLLYANWLMKQKNLQEAGNVLNQIIAARNVPSILKEQAIAVLELIKN